VRRETQERGLALDGPRRLKQALALRRVGPALLEIGEKPPGAFDAQQIDKVEAGFPHLGLELIGAMEEGGREVVLVRGVPVLAVAQIAGDDGREIRIAEGLSATPDSSEA